MKKIWIITLFPDFFNPFLESGVAGAALRGERGQKFEVNMVSLREFSPKNFKGVDAAPFGGGAGMVMRPDVLKNAIIEGIVEPGGYGEDFKNKLHIIFPNPRGKTWNNKTYIHNILSHSSKKQFNICNSLSSKIPNFFIF